MVESDKEQLAMAEFMEIHFIPKGTLAGQPNDSWNVQSKIPIYLSNWSSLHFKDDPAWLFPVMDKIERIAIQQGIVSGLYLIERSKNTFEMCMKFIQWYNKQTQSL